MFFISRQKLFSFSRKSNIRILHFQISWRPQIPKHKTNTLVNNLGSKHSLLMKFSQFMSYYKGTNFIKKFYKNCGLKTSSRPFCVCKELSTTSIGKWNFWIKPLSYVIAKLSNFVQINMPISSESFLQRILWKFKRT